MINHHPSDEILDAYINAELPVSVSVAVSIHTEMCEVCAEKVAKKTEQAAQQDFAVQEEAIPSDFDFNFNDMLDAITLDDSRAPISVQAEKHIEIAGRTLEVPRALSNIEYSDWLQLGKLRRSRMTLEDGPLRSSMLYIDADGDVPHHTHNGFEITLLLDGEFSDEMGHYRKGDFIWLDGQHKHQPKTENGCLCYTVVSDSLHFSQGLSRLLNPIGKLIY